MRKMWIVVVSVVLLALVGLGLAACSKPAHAGDPTKLQVTFSAEEQHKLDAVKVTPAELAAANCEAGARCYIAVDGVVYDMSVFPSWARGRHHGVEAGTDATEKFVKSGHARAYLEKMPVVGRLTA